MQEKLSQDSISESAHAKVNLTLCVRGRRADGYHDLDSLVVFAESPFDTLVLKRSDVVRVATSGPFAHLIGDTNLLDQTLIHLYRLCPDLVLGSVELKKNIPVAAGLGGGSADAGALLRAVRRANSALGDTIDWSNVATQLGADVLSCYVSRAVMMSGAGERLTELDGLARVPILLVNPMVLVPADKTARVFSALDSGDNRDLDVGPSVFGNIKTIDGLLSFMRAFGNDLESAAVTVVPEILQVKAALRSQKNCQYVGLSGAGPTCFGVFNSIADAQRADT